jgi:hypothetical protein
LILVLTLLWMMIIVNLATTWDIIYSAFVINNNSPLDILAFLLSGPGAIEKLSAISGMIAFLFADGLLVSISRVQVP